MFSWAFYASIRENRTVDRAGEWAKLVHLNMKFNKLAHSAHETEGSP